MAATQQEISVLMGYLDFIHSEAKKKNAGDLVAKIKLKQAYDNVSAGLIKLGEVPVTITPGEQQPQSIVSASDNTSEKIFDKINAFRRNEEVDKNLSAYQDLRATLQRMIQAEDKRIVTMHTPAIDGEKKRNTFSNTIEEIVLVVATNTDPWVLSRSEKGTYNLSHYRFWVDIKKNETGDDA